MYILSDITFYDFFMIFIYICVLISALISLILFILFSSEQCETFQLNVIELLHNCILIICYYSILKA